MQQLYFLKYKTLGYKPNPVLHEKSPEILGQKLKKSLGLIIGEEIRYMYQVRSSIVLDLIEMN